MAAALAVLAALSTFMPSAWAQARPGAGGIYSCIDGNGRRLTSDRPIPECTTREQRVLNEDGSLRRVVPPQMTSDERAAREAQERREAAELAARRDATRRDRNLMNRFPNEAAHGVAREQALSSLQRAMTASVARLEILAKERKPLLDESEFFVGKPLPTKLKQQLEANDAAVRAQRDAVQTQRAEIARVDALFDAELERLRRLWAGAAPGSLGPALEEANANRPTTRPGSGATPAPR